MRSALHSGPGPEVVFPDVEAEDAARLAPALGLAGAVAEGLACGGEEEGALPGVGGDAMGVEDQGWVYGQGEGLLGGERQGGEYGGVEAWW